MHVVKQEEVDTILKLFLEKGSSNGADNDASHLEDEDSNRHAKEVYEDHNLS